ncbi:OmpA family protein [Fulvivirgaceae bacterium BMA10]|uniref:OmpA family protein n=1 Tax=Splendidivirga corallicola TaxID=3051826 RepID=A0ABT8KNH8_9BACT|nr:OmpA family protein [Fulvivirgaceae bacterium BMA10]
MLKRLFIAGLFIFLLLGQLIAQSPKKLIRKGDKFFQLGFYDRAAEYYIQANDMVDGNASLDYRIGLAYMEGSYRHRALEHLKKVYDEFPDFTPELNYLIGQAYQFNHNFEKALEHYHLFRPNAIDKFTVDQNIKQCNIGIEYVNNPKEIKITNLGPVINSKSHDYAPLITADESMMIFTSRREGSTGGELSYDNTYYEDIYFSYNGGDSWSSPAKIPGSINTEYHECAIAFSPDGKKILIYYSTGEGDIYVSDFEGTQWTKPKPLNANINSKYRELSASITADGKRLYFSSDRPGGFGGLDIYYSELQDNGQWGRAVNCGPKINTKENEDAPFIHPDGKMLYFSSQGHLGLGGFDIFRSPKIKDSWGIPRNLGYPINTAQDDLYFVISSDNKRGYYATARDDGYGGNDIYSILMDQRDYVKPATASTNQEVQPTVEPQIKALIDESGSTPLIIFKGAVLDAQTDEPIQAKLVLSDNSRNIVAIVDYSKASDGEFELRFPANKNYGLSVEKDGYLFHSTNFRARDIKQDKEIDRVIRLKKAEIGSRVILKNIFFDSGKDEIKHESIAELDRIYELLRSSPNLKVQINGHTDNVGEANYNKTLSKKRAKAVERYLISYGVDPNRLSSKGFGEERPLVSNDDEIGGREINRRTEIEIIGN